MHISKSASNLAKSFKKNGRNLNSQSKSKSIRAVGLAKSKIKCYERAREILYEGGITTSNVEKQFIQPQRKNIYNSSSVKRSMQVSPPRFTPHTSTYNDSKVRNAIIDKEKKEQEIIKEWTFTPHISNPNRYFRNADEFYEDQQRHVINKIDKLNLLDQDIQHKENATHKPYLSKISEEIATKKRVTNTPIHERLYSEYSAKKLKEGINSLMSIKNSYK